MSRNDFPSSLTRPAPRNGDVVFVQGFEFLVSDVEFAEVGTTRFVVRFVGTCTDSPRNDSIRNTPYNGGRYGHNVPAEQVPRDAVVRRAFLGMGYTSHERRDGSGVLYRFKGSPGEFVATEFGPGAYFRTAEAAFDYYADEERQTAAAERRCPQM